MIQYLNRPSKTVNEIVHKMQTCALGNTRKTINFSTYNPKWKEAFDWLESKIANELKDISSYKIEHFGSTSIPEISAKPILDVMIIFNSLSDLESSIPLLENLGFIYKGDALSKIHKTQASSNRRGFSFYDMDEITAFINLHIFINMHPDVELALRFRDRLRSSSELTKEYQELKIKLKSSTDHHYEYTRRKSEFIKQVIN